MNKTLSALQNKLSWQLEDVKQRLQSLHHEQTGLEKTQTDLQHHIHKACTTSATIHPEQEIARLHFIRHKHQEYSNLNSAIKDLAMQIQQLTERQNRLQKEMKILERYQIRLHEKHCHKEKLQQQNNLSEWILHRKKPYEN